MVTGVTVGRFPFAPAADVKAVGPDTVTVLPLMVLVLVEL